MKIKAVDIVEDSLDKERMDKDYNKIVFTKLITTHAFKYMGCCLVATQNPLEFVKTNFYPIVQKLKEKFNIKSINSVYEKYKKDTKNIKEMIDKIRLKYTSESVQEEKINDLLRNKPCIIFPSSIQVNSTDHIKGFAKYVKSYDSSLTKNSIMPESIDITNFNIDDDLKFLLYMGVGIYSHSLDRDYCNQVLELLSDRQLAFIISDDSFCYGANYQISNVIINDDLCDNHSINTILQLIGRTSRIGKSWAGKVYLDNNTSSRILKFFETPNSNIIECTNIVSTFNNIVPIIKNEELQKKLKEETKIASTNKDIQKLNSSINIPRPMADNAFTINRPQPMTNNADKTYQAWGHQPSNAFTINRPRPMADDADNANKAWGHQPPNAFTINRPRPMADNADNANKTGDYQPPNAFTINRPRPMADNADNDRNYKPPNAFTINRPRPMADNADNANKTGDYQPPNAFTINRPRPMADNANNANKTGDYQPPNAFTINRPRPMADNANKAGNYKPPTAVSNSSTTINDWKNLRNKKN
jgi:hypothetical protein